MGMTAMDEGTEVPLQEDTGSRTLSAMGERVAVVETTIREALPVIRNNIHGINNELQKVVAQGERCDRNLELILAKLTELPTIASAAATFATMHPDLREVLKEREQGLGLAAFGRRFGMIVAAVAALVAVIGGIAGGLVWLSQHLKPM